MKSKILALSSNDRSDAFRAASLAHKSQLPPYIIEKDFWVCLTLEILYSVIAPTLTARTSKPFILKGGTSLSKGYDLINRMSEDIDLSFSLPLLAADPITPQNAASRKARKRAADIIEEKAEAYIKDELLPVLIKELALCDSAISVEVESQYPLNIAIYYPKALPDTEYGSAVQPRVLLETGGRSADLPDDTVEITHMAGEAIAAIADDKFTLLTLSPARTLLEKVFGVHSNNIKNRQPKQSGPIVGDKYARHLYDIVKLHNHNPLWVTNKTLFDEVVVFCDHYYKWHLQSCETAIAGELQLVPVGIVLDAYRADWAKMADMFPHGQLPMTFDELLLALKEVETIAVKSLGISKC